MAALIVFTVWIVQATFFIVIEEIYMHIFKKPLYIHFYPRKKRPTEIQESILRQEFPFYNTLSEKHKGYFKHRMARFIEKHEFIGKEGFVITDQVKVLISATAVMLTFGMRKYLFEVVQKIIVYPGIYLSTITEQYHKGEFNPRVKAVVFSWEDFLKGYETHNDNLNLGLHEFSHVVHYHGTKNEDPSAILFTRMYKRITEDLKEPGNLQKLIDSNYFRIYAYTDHFEFLAVIIEHYFETPQQFHQEFPELYRNVSIMLNHRHAESERQSGF
ncbi:zinc-dependent peptidase [Flavobacterium sp.]|uniref:zinc-dependent peptidase n=1 Tax=Flavobacterium sp. TaxID=239 RepID=UPI0039E55FB5